MPRQNKHHDKQCKLDAVNYVKEHPDLTQEECCKNLGIALSTLQRWLTLYRDNDGDVPTRGSGNYASDEQKEIARLKKELRDTQDALEILKKLSAFWAKTNNSHYRGSQYVSQAYRDATEKMCRSYSHKGYTYDNTCIESFHSLIKREWLNRFKMYDYNHAYRLVFEYI